MISAKVHRRVRFVLKRGATLAYWCSDAQGRPANHKPAEPWSWTAKEGLIQEVAGPLSVCGPHALHATLTPHKWAGTRVWLVALWGEVQHSADKMGALRREILCEIFPEDAIDATIGVRIGCKGLQSADLYGADLQSADLYGADLRSANLRSADLQSADLYGADLRSANLQSADLYGADLRSANLSLPEGWELVNGIARGKA